MKSATAQRNDIIRQVRAVLARYWIDLGFLSIKASEQTIYIRGSLKRLAGVPEPLSGAVVEAMFSEIKQVRVQAEFENWHGSVTAGGWTSREAAAVTNGERMRTASSGAGSTFTAQEVPVPQA